MVWRHEILRLNYDSIFDRGKHQIEIKSGIENVLESRLKQDTLEARPN
jgi:hypothetical protein